MRWKTIAGIGVGLLAAAVIARGVANSRRLVITRKTISFPDLPPAFDGFRILQLTDIHLKQSSQAEKLVELVRFLNADLVCLTGDYVFNRCSFPTIDRFFAEMARFPAVYAIYGNADYHNNTSARIRASWARLLPFLVNAAVPLVRDGERLWLAGVDDPHLYRDNLRKALESVPPAEPVILLAHSPEIIQRPLDPRVRLILSGHTHGGQICLPGGQALYHNTRLPAIFSSGRHQIEDAVLYVSRGIGSTRLPFRFGCLPEVTEFTLRRS